MTVCMIRPILLADLFIALLAAIVLTVIWGLGQRARRVLRETQQAAQQKIRESDPMFDYSHLQQQAQQNPEPCKVVPSKFQQMMKAAQDYDASHAAQARTELYRQLIAHHDPNLCVMCGQVSEFARQTGFCHRCTEMLNQRVRRAEKESAE